MKRHPLYYVLPLALLFPILAGGLLLFHVTKATPAQLSSLLEGTSLNVSQAQESIDGHSFDSRLCLAHRSAVLCTGVLPFGPHFSVLSRDEGSGYCFDEKQMELEDQQIKKDGKTIGDFQLWYLPSCNTYTSHLLFGFDADTPPTISAQVNQFDGSGIINSITKMMWHLGSEDSLLPSATQIFGPRQDREIWSPMLYSPTAPVQASATIESAAMTYGPISSYYAAGKSITINGRSV